MKVLKVNYPVKTVEQLMIMGHCNQGSIVMLNALKKQIKNAGFVFRVEVSCRLVSKYQPWVGQQCPANGGPLFFSLGKLK